MQRSDDDATDAEDTAAEIAQLESRLAELRRDRFASEAAVATARADRASARLSGEKAKRSDPGKAQAELGELDEAIALGASRLEDLRVRHQKLAAAIAEQRRRGELASIAAALPEAGELLDGAIAIVERVDPARERRSLIYAALGRVFVDAIDRSNSGRAFSTADAIAELAERYRRDAEPAGPILLRPALASDTIVEALKSFRFRDAGNREIVSVELAAGAVALVPSVVAQAAASRSLAKVLIEPRPPGQRRVKFIQADRSEDDGITYPRNGIFVLEKDAAERAIREGKAVEHAVPSVHELERVRRLHAKDLTPTVPIDLGVFNDAVADDFRAFAELACAGPPAEAAPAKAVDNLVEAFAQ